MAPYRCHDPKEYIVEHQQRIGLSNTYQRDQQPDDSLFEDAVTFQDVLECMVVQGLPTLAMTTLEKESRI